ncbi:MAG: hypothetical protein RMK20_02605 [Verrucomicrobiales bacterium]|nr:hypothetical protein [Verrucomicrobiales bacterium]
MDLRREFLLRLFARLDARRVPWCILRNYTELLDNPDTDLDVLVAPEARGEFETLLERTAQESGFDLVQSVERACFSRIYRHPVAGFFRVDYYTDLRWRLFPILPAAAVLASRRRADGAGSPGLEAAFVPAPEQESALLWMAAIWRGYLSERYQARLIELRAACESDTALRAALRAAYGQAGETLALLQERLPQGRFEGEVCARVRRSLMLGSLSSGWRLRALLRNALLDARRFVRRMRQPAGATLLYFTATGRPRDFEELSRRLDFALPAKRWAVHRFQLSAAGRLRWGWRQRLARWRTVFQGGVFVAVGQASNETALAAAERAARRGRFTSRQFVCLETREGEVLAAHAGTGFLAQSSPSECANDAAWAAWLADFLSTTFRHQIADQGARTGDGGGERRQHQGAFCVLVGLDGAGKTTLARELIAELARSQTFHGVRYFHWLPSCFGVEWPWHQPGNRPKRRALAHGPLAGLLSMGRLFKNLARARVAWVWRLRPWLKRGRLVLLDRYFYNYFLDPVSVNYGGPRWLLARAARWFPEPELVVVLRAPAAVLLSRKQELTEQELREQAARLEALDFGRARVLPLDATRRPGELVDEVRRALSEFAGAD